MLGHARRWTTCSDVDVSHPFMFHTTFHSSSPKNLMSFIIGGTPASVVYSPDVFPSRMSMAFVHALNTSVAPNGVISSSVTAPTPSGAFTSVLDFVVIHEPCEFDVVLGLDWSESCRSLNVNIFVPQSDIGRCSLFC